MVLLENKDRPGVIGFVGNTFGDAGVNIADMVISREVKPDGTAHALMVIKTDQEPSADLVDTLKAKDPIVRVRTVTMPARGK